MSETDDTDELLLIPPDFFLSDHLLDSCSPNQAPYYSVVDGLITQVGRLANRIRFIESSSDISASFISDSSEMQSPASRRKYARDDSPSSKSTPQKPRSKFTMSSLPNSPDVSTLKKSPQQSRMLGEIDNFLSNVKQIKRLNAVRNLDNDFNVNRAENGPKASNKLDQLLNEPEKLFTKTIHGQCGDNVSSVPDRGFGIRDSFYPENKNDHGVDTDASSESTQATAFEHFKYKGNKTNESVGDDNYNLGLVSLAKLWSSDDGHEMPSKFQQKLQEERLRRQHCERAILDLQNRVLELQERMAVAIQVDDAKDKAISRFHDSWERAGSKLQELERQKEHLEEEVEKLRKKLSRDCDDTNHRIERYEKEASTALNMAKGSQEKLSELERRYQHLEAELKTSEVNSEEFQRKYLEEMERNKQFTSILAQKELELNECKSVLIEARKEVTQSKMAVEVCQSEVISMKGVNETLQEKLDAQQEISRKASEQATKLLEEISACKSVEKTLREDVGKAREQIETNKVELKSFYQGQVELVVQNKLKEFQKQLDETEKAMKEQLSRKELSIVKNAATHIQQISEKHSLEIKLLEEKQQEERRLYHLQVSQLRHELEEANRKVKRQHEKHIHIERHLHKFMESLKQDHVSTLEDLNSFRSKSFSNLEEILSFDVVGDEAKAEHESGGRLKWGETPVSSRNEKSVRRKERENSLQETIQMLLDKKGTGDESTHRSSKGKPPWK